MKRIACPLHIPLGGYCAETILEQHAASLPDLTGMAILVPNATSGRALRSALLDHAPPDRPGLLLPPILPLRTWAQQHSRVDGVENHLGELLDLVAVLQKGDILGSETQADSWALAREMMHLFDQLWLNEILLPPDQEELTSRLREAYGIAGKPPDQLGDEARIIHLLWTAWSESSGKFLSSGKYYREALRNLAPPAETQAIYVCGPDRLLAAEIEALERLSAEIPVTLFTRPEALIAMDAEPLAAAEPPSPHASVLQEAYALEKSTMAERARSCRKDYPEDPLAGRLSTFVAEQAESHACGIDIQIRRWLKEGHQHIGLVTEDRKLARRVHALLKRANVHVQDYAGWALSTTSAATTIKRWLECLNENFHYLALLDVLKSPFVHLGEAPGNPAGIGNFEKLLHIHNVHNDLSNYRQLAKDVTGWSGILDQVEKAAGPIQALRDPTGEEYMNALLESLDILGCRPCLADDDAGKRVLGELEKMRAQLSQNQTRLPKSQWDALLRWTLERESFRPKSPQARVSLINLNQAHLARFDRLIVAGMDSRHYPGANSGSFAFNDSVRGDLGLPTRTDLKKLSLQRFLSLILSSGKVLLTYQKVDQDEPLLPSIWWTQIDVFHRLAYKAGLDEPSLSVLSLHPDAQVRPPGLQVREPSSEGMPRPCASADLLPDTLSVGAHQALVDCPYRFYVQRMLRIREPEVLREEMDSLEFGTYVHQCLEAFHSDIPGAPGPWPGPLNEAKFAMLAALERIDKTFKFESSDDIPEEWFIWMVDHEAAAIKMLDEIGEHFMKEQTPSFSNKIFLQKWKAIARHYVTLQKSNERWRLVYETEKEMECKFKGVPKLVGRIDRLDVKKNTYTIVTDYKTNASRIPGHKVVDGEQVQLPSYALMVDGVEEVEYWWLGVQPNSKGEPPRTILAGKELNELSKKVGSRLYQVFQDLQEGHEMPANGDDTTCEFCYAQGVCRKDLEAGGSQ